jgi:enoyl-CoA hydratase/carnithine racemase
MSDAPLSPAPRVEVVRGDHGVVTLVLSDERRRNALTEALGDALAAAVASVRDDPTVRVVVLRGAGNAFSAGGDLAMLQRLRNVTSDEAYAHMRSFYGRWLSLLELPVPVIAAITGPAIGAGLCVAIAADLLVVAKNAALAFNFTALGLHPGMGATYFLPRRVGEQRARELLFSGRRFDGDEAAQMGLALEALPDSQVHTRATALAEAIAKAGPLAVRAVKRTLKDDRQALEACLDREARAQADSYAGPELGEGLRALQEKRPPVF